MIQHKHQQFAAYSSGVDGIQCDSQCDSVTCTTMPKLLPTILCMDLGEVPGGLLSQDMAIQHFPNIWIRIVENR